jgi:hypothetical protein
MKALWKVKIGSWEKGTDESEASPETFNVVAETAMDAFNKVVTQEKNQHPHWNRRLEAVDKIADICLV